MKKVLFLMVGIIVFAFVTTAQADNKRDATSISVTGGGYFFEGNQGYKNYVTGGLRLGYNFTENLGAEMFFNYVPTEYEDSGASMKFAVGGLEALYHFMPRSAFVPFVAVGAGAVRYTGSGIEPSKVAVDYGAGFKYFMTDHIAFRADARHVLPLGETGKYGDNPHKVHNDLLATVGLMFSFGGDDRYAEQLLNKLEEEKAAKEQLQEQKQASVAEPEPVVVAQAEKQKEPATAVGDADRDGVPDNIDECPNTPASVVVDKKGCPPDSDKDGVPDYQDRCPKTTAKFKVDQYGCPPDSDKDGVPDDRDRCPQTPSGAKVADDGCVHQKVSLLLKLEFDFGKAAVKKAYHQELQKAAAFMKEHPEATATIVGHTDNLEKRKMELSQARAENVRRYLIKNFGIDGSRIRALSFGAEKPIANNKTKEGRKKNRRVVALFEAVEKK